MLNHITIMGRLVADPELRTTPQGVTVATMRLAVDRDAEFVSRFFTKGRMAVVEGRLQIRPYTDRDGNKRTAAEVVAENIYFGDSRRDGESGSYAPPASYGAPAQPSMGYSAPPMGGDQFAELADDDGDLPF